MKEKNKGTYAGRRGRRRGRGRGDWRCHDRASKRETGVYVIGRTKRWKSSNRPTSDVNDRNKTCHKDDGQQENINDDVVRQLARQRANAAVAQHQLLFSAPESFGAAGSSRSEGKYASASVTAVTEEVGRRQKGGLPLARLGRFVYNPSRKAYFPATALMKNQWQDRDNDVQENPGMGAPSKIARMRLPSFVPSVGPPLSSEASVENMIYQVAICPSATKRKNLFRAISGAIMTRDAKFVATAETCPCHTDDTFAGSFSNRREEVRSNHGSRSVYSGGNSRLRHGTRGGKCWASMFHPMVVHSVNERFFTATGSRGAEPFDCRCKEHLHPVFPTFDVCYHARSSSTRDSQLFPSIVTLFGRCAYYYPSSIPSLFHVDECRGVHSFNQRRSSSDQQIPHVLDLTTFQREIGNGNPQAIRFAPCNYSTGDTVAVLSKLGCKAKQVFSIREAPMELTEGNLRYNAVIPDEVNDFSFSNDSARIVFASNTSSKSSSDPYVLDVTTGQFQDVTSLRGKPAMRSDIICAEFDDHTTNSVLYGHRNGSISMVDLRSHQVVLISNKWSNLSAESPFGYVSCLRSLSEPFVILARGSFGACLTYDVRRHGKLKAGRPPPSQLHNYAFPPDIKDDMKTVHCAGLAVNTSACVAVSPFVDINGRPCIALWSSITGKFLGYRQISGNSDRADPRNSQIGPVFCELSRHVTPSWEIQKEPLYDVTCKQKSWGLWFKCGHMSAGVPLSVPGIQHMGFPGCVDP